MYGSLFREWKTAALFVGGIAIVVGVFFSEGGGYEQLQLKRRQPEPVASAAPLPPRTTPVGLAQPVGFTPDEELEAAYEGPSEAVEATDQGTSANGPGAAAPLPASANTGSVAESPSDSTAAQQLP